MSENEKDRLRDMDRMCNKLGTIKNEKGYFQALNTPVAWLAISWYLKRHHSLKCPLLCTGYS